MTWFSLPLLFLACGPTAPVSSANSEPAAVISNQFSPAWAPSGKANITPFATGENAFFGKLWLAANARVPEHQDATEEYLYILSGGGTIHINGVPQVIAAGHAVYMPAGATVSFENGSSPLEAIQVFAGPSPADKYTTWSTTRP